MTGGSWRLPLSLYPGINRFVLDWLAGETRATSLLRRGEKARPPSRRPGDPRLGGALEESNRAWGIDARPAIETWRGGGLAIIAGQQVGFAGGPLYTLSKLATIVRMKRDLERQGVPATAFFWLATEDHDFAEVATLNLPVAMIAKEKDVDRRCDLVCTSAARTSDPRSAVGLLPVPESLVAALTGLLGIERPGWLREGINFRDSFAQLVAELFGNEVVLVDSLLPEVRRAGAPLFEKITHRRDEIQQTLKRRGAELESAGYREQVVARDGDEYTLLFELDAENRRVAWTPGSSAAPERISTSAITRPLLQDFVFEPDIFVGGPAEVTYYAQICALHELLDVPMPRVALRGHLLLATPRAARNIERWEIDPASVFRSADEIVATKEPEAVAQIEARVQAAKLDLLAQIERIREAALPADHSLAGSISRSVGHIEYHFDKLRERAVRAALRKEKERWTAARDVVAGLYPDGKVQERIVNWFPWWLRFGGHLVERMIAGIEPDTDSFGIVRV